MKASVIIICFLFCSSLFGQNDIFCKKVLLPISQNGNGLPICKTSQGFLLDGYETDGFGNHYLFYSNSSGSTILSKVSNGKEVFRKYHNDINPSRIYLNDSTILTFNYNIETSKLFFLNDDGGETLKIVNMEIKYRVNSHSYTDTSVILQVVHDPMNIENMFRYVGVNYNGTKIYELSHGFGLFNELQDLPFKISDEWDRPWYLGEWNEFMLFYIFDFETFGTVFLIYNPEQKTTKIYKFQQGYFGDSLYDPRLELIKLRNNKIFVVGYENNTLIINSIELNDMFPVN